MNYTHWQRSSGGCRLASVHSIEIYFACFKSRSATSRTSSLKGSTSLSVLIFAVKVITINRPDLHPIPLGCPMINVSYDSRTE